MDSISIDTPELSGDHVSYYTLAVPHPTTLPTAYTCECIDIIKHLNMSFSEGEVFKALWRMCAARTLGLTKTGNTALYDAEKIARYGDIILTIEKRKEPTP